VLKKFKWLLILEVKKNTDTPVVYYVVGNKTDLINTRSVMYEEAKEFADSVNAHYWETSVYSNTGKILSRFYVIFVYTKMDILNILHLYILDNISYDFN